MEIYLNRDIMDEKTMYDYDDESEDDYEDEADY